MIAIFWGLSYLLAAAVGAAAVLVLGKAIEARQVRRWKRAFMAAQRNAPTWIPGGGWTEIRPPVTPGAPGGWTAATDEAIALTREDA